MKLSRLIFFCFLLIASPIGWADCMQKAATPDAINVCQHSLAKAEEIKLKKLVEAVQLRFRGTQKDRFNDSQQLWEKMTKRDCEIEADFFEGAPVYMGILSQCLQKRYQQRFTQIQFYLCPDHSLSKSCPRSEQFISSLQP